MLSSICNKQVVPIITPLYSGNIEVIISTEVVGVVGVVEVVEIVKAAKITWWTNFSRSKPYYANTTLN